MKKFGRYGGRGKLSRRKIIYIILLIISIFSEHRWEVSGRSWSLISGQPYVTDGDTLWVQGTKVRLYGIDAPELDQTCSAGGRAYPCGEEARVHLAALSRATAFNCVEKGHDKYRRVEAVCYADNVDIGQQMVRSGWALAYREYSKAYIPAEDMARKSKLGIWSGHFEKPADYRKKQANRL